MVVVGVGVSSIWVWSGCGKWLSFEKGILIDM